MKKVFLAAAFAMGLATVSFAGNPKGETKDANTEAKTEVKAETKANQVLTTYYVNGGNATTYNISTTQTKSCGSGSVACTFTSPDPALPSTISRATVDQEQEDIDVLEWRSAL